MTRKLEKCERIVEQAGRRWRVTVAQDAGERVAAERDRARYKAIVATQTDWIARQRPDGRLTFVNQAYCQWMGMTADQLLSPDYCGLDLVDDPEDLARSTPTGPRSAPSGRRPINELRTRHPDGSKRWEQWTDTAIFDADGTVVEYQLVGREITEQKQTEIALAEQRGALPQRRRIAERPDHPRSPRRPGDLRQRRLLPLHGHDREQLLDPSWDDLSPLSAEDRARILADVGRA